MTKFPIRLKEARTDKNLSRRELAKLLLIQERTISYWELGQRECNLEQLASLAKLLGVTADYLLGLEE